MSKKSLDRKLAQKTITESRVNGITDHEIYQELSEKYYDKKSIALLITSTVTTENKNKYKVYNNILIGLLGLYILLKLLTIFSLISQTGELWALLLVFFVPIISCYFMYEISRYNGPLYRFLGILAIANFFQTLSNSINATDILINLIFAGAVAGLSFYLDSKMFPNYSPNNLKKDNNGEYILN